MSCISVLTPWLPPLTDRLSEVRLQDGVEDVGGEGGVKGSPDKMRLDGRTGHDRRTRHTAFRLLAL